MLHIVHSLGTRQVSILDGENQGCLSPSEPCRDGILWIETGVVRVRTKLKASQSRLRIQPCIQNHARASINKMCSSKNK